jgi:hypothetical protein
VTSVSSRSLQAVLNRLSLPVRRATSKLPACNRDVEARTRAKTSESAGPGPGNPSDPEGPCRRRHGCCWPCAGRQAPASRWRAPQFCIQQTDTVYRVCSASTLVVQWCELPCSMHKVVGSNPEIIFLLPILIY